VTKDRAIWKGKVEQGADRLCGLHDMWEDSRGRNVARDDVSGGNERRRDGEI
jgi:hypothetical protein